MASSDVFVTFGGDTGALEAAISVVKAQMNALTREMKSAATEFNKTGASAESDLGQKLKGLGDKMAAAKDHMSGLQSGAQASGEKFAAAKGGVETFNKSLDKVSDFAWKNTNLSGDEIDRVINPLKGMALALGVVGTVGVASVLAVGAGFAFVAIKAHEARVAAKSLTDQMALGGQIGAFTGIAEEITKFTAQATHMSGAWDIIGKGAALSADEAKKFGEVVGTLPGVTHPMIKAFTELAREERYAFGQDGLNAIQNFASALKKPEQALQTLIAENMQLTPAQRQAAQSALESGNAHRQAATYYDLITQELIKQKTAALAAEVSISQVSHATKLLADDAASAAAAGGNLEAALQRLGRAGISAANDLLKVVGSIRAIHAEMGKTNFGAEFANQLQGTLDKLDPASAKVRATASAWSQSKSDVAALTQSIAEMEGKQGNLNELTRQRGLLLQAQRVEQLAGQANREALGDQRGVSDLDQKTRTIELRYSVNKDEVSKARETTKVLQDELNSLPDNESFAAKRHEINEKLVDSRRSEVEAEKAIASSKIDYEINKLEAGEEKKKLIRQKYAGELAGLTVGSAAWYDKKTAMDSAIEGAEPSAKGGGKSKGGASDTRKDAQEESKAAIDAAKATFEQKKSLLDEYAKLHIISAAQQIAGTRAAANEEYAAQKAALEKELKLQDLKPSQRRTINDQIQKIEAQHQKEMQKLQFQAVNDEIKDWTRMVDTMSSSLSSGLSGMIEGTQTFRQSMQALAQGVERQFVKMGVDLVADWTKSMIAQVALSHMGEAGKTTAAATGAAARGGIAAGEASAGMAVTLASVLKSISASAAETFAGVFGFLSPVMGPLAAGPAAAAQGAVLSVAAFDIGAWSLDRDQLAMVHKNEMIMPAAESGAFRSMLTNAANGGGRAPAASGGDSHVHLNVSALDAASVKSWLSGNSREIMKAMDQAMRHGNHLGLRRLGGG